MVEIHYLGLALDPIHVGTGEFQLGRVDNTIVREPATGIPKIPGSSLAGPARAYTAMNTPPPDKATGTRYLHTKDAGKTYQSCAGKGGGAGDDHCGRRDCPVCVGFGFSRGENKSSFQGLATFSDARILLFPVPTATGPVWITTPTVLEEAGFLEGNAPDLWREKLGSGNESKAWKAGNRGPLRLGWMSVPPPEAPPQIDLSKLNTKLTDVRAGAIPSRIVLVSDFLFRALVNDNLEVRTSVSISPKTGTAEPGALFTAEAIPRTTVFWSWLSIQDHKYFRIGNEEITVSQETLKGEVWKALQMMETLGVGGLNTRGFGRFRVGGSNGVG